MRLRAGPAAGGGHRPVENAARLDSTTPQAGHLSFADVKFIPPPNLARRDPRNPWARFKTGLGVLTLVLIAGTGGYVMLGLDPLDAIYQTVITISTVGYREIGEVAERYKVFTVFLILFGTGTSLYTLGVLIETMFEGRLDDQFRRRRMQRGIDRMKGHVVLCGYGQVGRAIEEELLKAGEAVVAVDRQEPKYKRFPEGHRMVMGDATEDSVLLQAGLDRASTLVVALNSDVDNLFITLTARAINSDLFIVARANESVTVPKLQRAGASRVVNPQLIGGARMAALVSDPEVVEFLDVVMHNGEFEIRLSEILVTEDSAFAGRSLAGCGIRTRTGVTVLSVRRGNDFATNPPADFVFLPGDLLISLGTAEQLTALRKRAREG